MAYDQDPFLLEFLEPPPLGICKSSHLKLSFIIINSLVMVSGLSMMSLVLYQLHEQGGLVYVVNDLDSQRAVRPGSGSFGLIETTVITVSVSAICIVLVAVVGILGAKHDNYCLVMTFAVFMILVLLGKYSATIVFLATAEVTDQELKRLMIAGLRNYYDGARSPANYFSRAFNRIQIDFKCCGINNYLDFRKEAVRWVDRVHFMVPLTCCQLSNREELIPIDIKCPIIPYPNNSYIEHPCFMPVRNYFHDYFAFLTIMALTMSALEVTTVALSCWILAYISRKRRRAANFDLPDNLRIALNSSGQFAPFTPCHCQPTFYTCRHCRSARRRHRTESEDIAPRSRSPPLERLNDEGKADLSHLKPSAVRYDDTSTKSGPEPSSGCEEMNDSAAAKRVSIDLQEDEDKGRRFDSMPNLKQNYGISSPSQRPLTDPESEGYWAGQLVRRYSTLSLARQGTASLGSSPRRPNFRRDTLLICHEHEGSRAATKSLSVEDNLSSSVMPGSPLSMDHHDYEEPKAAKDSNRYICTMESESDITQLGNRQLNPCKPGHDDNLKIPEGSPKTTYRGIVFPEPESFAESLSPQDGDISVSSKYRWEAMEGSSKRRWSSLPPGVRVNLQSLPRNLRRTSTAVEPIPMLVKAGCRCDLDDQSHKSSILVHPGNHGDDAMSRSVNIDFI